MLSVQQPPSQLPRRRRSREKMTLKATDEFWFSPAAMEMEPPTPPAAPATAPSAPTDDADQAVEWVIPAAHRQLLSADTSSVEELKGYDHTLGPAYDDDDESYGSEEPSCFGARRKISSVKQKGGGSWLLGFVSLDESVGPERSGDDDGRLSRVPSGASLDSDECSESSDDDTLSVHSSGSGSAPSVSKPARRGVSFNTSVVVQPIPHSTTLSLVQRRKMFSTTIEVRHNKIRNKKEFRHDGCDWRRATEEWEMSVDMATGELVHPAHVLL